MAGVREGEGRGAHDRNTLFLHLSDEDGDWMDRHGRRPGDPALVVAQARRQREAAEEAFGRLYPGA